MLVDYNGVNSYWVYNLLIKRVKIYHNVKFHKYETTNNADISNKFQYTEFDKYKESETIKIDISKLTNQNTSTEPSIEPFTEVQNIGFHNVLPEPININITPHCSECNWQPICY